MPKADIHYPAAVPISNHPPRGIKSLSIARRAAAIAYSLPILKVRRVERDKMGKSGRVG